MPILCAADFSQASRLALAAAGRIATTFAEPLTVVTVADPLLAAAERVASGTDPIALLRGALASFVGETLGAEGASRVQLSVPVGDPAAEILREADAIDADLIVVSTQGASGMSRFVFGSVAERVLRQTRRPVLVVPPAVTRGTNRALGALQEVLAPIDFHEHAVDDARVASRIAKASRGRLRLLHVVASDEDDRWTVLRQTAAAQLEEQLSGARLSQVERAREALERVADEIEMSPAPALEVVQGAIAEQIAQVAARAEVDLVVMGLRGAPGLLAARVGAVAYRVLCASPVPVLGIPHEARGGAILRFLGDTQRA